MLFVIKRLFYKGLVMTEDTFKIAEQIKKRYTNFKTVIN